MSNYKGGFMSDPDLEMDGVLLAFLPELKYLTFEEFEELQNEFEFLLEVA